MSASDQLEVSVRPYRHGYDDIKRIVHILDANNYRTGYTDGLPNAVKQTYIQVILLSLALVTFAVTGSFLLGLAAPLIFLFVRTLYYCLYFGAFPRFCCGDLRDIENVYQSEPDSNFFVAEINGRIVGYAAIVNEDSLHERLEEYSKYRNVSSGKLDSDVDSDVKIAELKRMVVDVSFRGLSIGRKLLDHCVEFCKQNNYDRIHLSAVTEQIAGLRLYSRYGFKRGLIEYERFRSVFMICIQHMSLNLDEFRAK
ncbi:putative N-acetyltransferase camello [Tubulanus polymorphus]|uniref:putative N-acetyltransferase camello n=1 Tax=Tubulanus polymorphus TaxID=672921 RepID=UPI003DA34F1B